RGGDGGEAEKGSPGLAAAEVEAPAEPFQPGLAGEEGGDAGHQGRPDHQELRGPALGLAGVRPHDAGRQPQAQHEDAQGAEQEQPAEQAELTQVKVAHLPEFVVHCDHLQARHRRSGPDCSRGRRHSATGDAYNGVCPRSSPPPTTASTARPATSTLTPGSRCRGPSSPTPIPTTPAGAAPTTSPPRPANR